MTILIKGMILFSVLPHILLLLTPELNQTNFWQIALHSFMEKLHFIPCLTLFFTSLSESSLSPLCITTTAD